MEKPFHLMCKFLEFPTKQFLAKLMKAPLVFWVGHWIGLITPAYKNVILFITLFTQTDLVHHALAV